MAYIFFMLLSASAAGAATMTNGLMKAGWVWVAVLAGITSLGILIEKNGPKK
jgi:hypothetical protein